MTVSSAKACNVLTTAVANPIFGRQRQPDKTIS